jgi:hypothetical protein
MAASRYERWTLPVMRPGTRSGNVTVMAAVDRTSVFRRAVLDLSEEPTLVNVRRYLAASRLLDRDALRRRSPRQPRKESDR